MNIAEQENSSRWDFFLLRLRYRDGRLIEVAGNAPVLLNDEQSAYIVYAGEVDIFAVKIEDGEPSGTRSHLFRAETRHGLFGLAQGDHRIGLLATGTAGTQLLRVQRATLEEMGRDPEFADPVALLVDSWIEGLSAGICHDLAPREFQTLEADHELVLPNRGVARVRNEVLWTGYADGAIRLCGRDDFPPLESHSLFPLTVHTWIVAQGTTRLLAAETTTKLEQSTLWAALDRFHALVLECVALNERTSESVVKARRLETRESADEAQVGKAFSELASTLNSAVTAQIGAIDASADPLFAACRLIGERLGIAIQKHPSALNGHPQTLKQIAQASRFRIREVALRGQWWTTDSGPLLAHIEADKRPVALLPGRGAHYRLHDPACQTVMPVTAEVAATLGPFAHMLYRPFPEQSLGLWQTVHFGLGGSWSDLLIIFLMALAAGVVGMLPPVLAGIIFDRIIPGAQRSTLSQIALILIMSALAVALFQASRNIAILRVEGKMEASIQAAVFDRLLDLPATFFRDYSAGDLGIRTLGISAIRQILSRAAISALFAGVTSTFNLALLFFYSVPLAIVALLLSCIFIVATLVESCFQVRYERHLAKIQGQLSGVVLQFVNGIAKFRVAGAERRAFAHWATLFARQRTVAYRARRLTNVLEAFTASFPLVAAMVIFGLLISYGESRLSTGSFLGFNIAFMQFLASMMVLSTAFTSSVRVIPIFERAKPILHTLPEVDANKADPGELNGEIEINSLSFRYRGDGPLVLDDVSLHILPGQFVALVGPSGSGKSTILRLLLGFEKPESGAVFYDGQELDGLDIRAVRRQIGVVLQNGKVMTGDIYTNIVGAAPLTMDDAWEAARMAGLDEDIRQMPMGMQTVISEGGTTISGGQRQRLLIARAIVNKPRIVFFDEATSALDNQTQAIISNSLESLEATRVVIAHRLSTVVNADHIFVIERGQVVQNGTYGELMNSQGLFTDLARRQLV